jgi:Spy/CpxP family protein refolding chaperone
MMLPRGLILTLILSALFAALGAWAGGAYVRAHVHRAAPLHELLHDQLHLTADQQQRLDELERDHAARRQALEAEMRAANAELAGAYQASHAYTPQIQAAIDRFHRASDALQKETMLHVIAMRQILSPGQTARFDETVVKSLTSPNP